MKVIKRKRSVAVLLALAVLAIAAVGAYAYFTSSGKGTGSASVGSVVDWNVSVANVSGGPLYPGSGVENKTYTVTNASAGKQLLQAVTIKIANGDGSVWDGTGTCSKDDFSINNLAGGVTATDTYGADPANDYANGAGPGAVAFTVKMIDTHANQDDCKGEKPPILVSAS